MLELLRNIKDRNNCYEKWKGKERIELWQQFGETLKFLQFFGFFFVSSIEILVRTMATNFAGASIVFNEYLAVGIADIRSGWTWYFLYRPKTKEQKLLSKYAKRVSYRDLKKITTICWSLTRSYPIALLKNAILNKAFFLFVPYSFYHEKIHFWKYFVLILIITYNL